MLEVTNLDTFEHGELPFFEAVTFEPGSFLSFPTNHRTARIKFEQGVDDVPGRILGRVIRRLREQVDTGARDPMEFDFEAALRWVKSKPRP